MYLWHTHNVILFLSTVYRLHMNGVDFAPLIYIYIIRLFTTLLFRVIVSILDAFHFDLSQSQLNVKLVPVVTTEVPEEQNKGTGSYK